MIRIFIFLVAGAGLIYVSASQLSNLSFSDTNPDSKVYFIDNLAEKMKLLTLRDPEEKIGKLLAYSGEKIEEIEYVLESENKNKAELLEKVLPKHEEYIKEALEEVQKLKEESSVVNEVTAGEQNIASGENKSFNTDTKINELETKISDKVLEKKELLNKAVLDAGSEEEKEVIEKEIIKTEVIIKKIIEQVEGPVREIIIYKTEQIDEAVEDKKEEDEVKNEQQKREELSETEKIYYIWIDNFYAKILPKANEQFFARAHIRRRDDVCHFFSGKMVLKIINAEWQTTIGRMQPNDDLWIELGPIDLPKGNYLLEGKLIDSNGRIISTKEFEVILD